MRKVTNYINEKFSEDSDPVEDLGIVHPIYNIKQWDIIEEIKKYTNVKLIEGYLIEWKGPIEYLIYDIKKKGNSLILLGLPYSIGGISKSTVKRVKRKSKKDIEHHYVCVIIEDTYSNLKNYFKVKTELNEKFVEDSDPITDLGLGNPFYNLKDGDIIRINPKIGYYDLFFDSLKRLNHPQTRRWNGAQTVFNVKHTGNKIIFGVIPFETYSDAKNCSKNILSSKDDPMRYFAYYVNDTPQNIKKHFEIFKEDVNEKFVEDSDPVEDLVSDRLLYKRFVNLKPGDLCVVKKQYDIKDFNERVVQQHFPGEIFKILSAHYRKDSDKIDVSWNNYKNKEEFKNNIKRRYSYDKSAFTFDYFKERFNIIPTENVKNLLSEKFVEDSDPVEDLGIIDDIYNLKTGDILEDIKGTSYTNFTSDSMTSLSHGYMGVYDVKIKGNKVSFKAVPVTYSINKISLKTVLTSKSTQELDKIYSTVTIEDTFTNLKKYFKIVKDINEKFVEDSDPIADLGIANDIYSLKPLDVLLCIDKYDNFIDIDSGDIESLSGLKLIIYNVIRKDNILIFKGIPFNERYPNISRVINLIKNKSNREIERMYICLEVKDTFNNLKKYFKVIKNVDENLNEKFIEDSDPLVDLGIGGLSLSRFVHKITKEQEAFLENTIKTLLLNKTIKGTFNQMWDVSQGRMDKGNGWGEYILKVEQVVEEDLYDSITRSKIITVVGYDRKAYIIPVNDDKIFIS